MAFTANISSNYVGKDAGEYIGASFKEADTISKNLVTVMPDIDYQIHLKKIAYADGRTDYTCGFTPAGSVTLSEKILAPKKIKNDLEICKEDLRQIWSSASMGFSAHNNNLPTDVESALIAEVLADMAENLDYDIWQGLAATDGSFTGFISLFGADGNVIKAANGITSLNGAVTKSNVISELEKVINVVPIALRRKADFKILVSPDIANFYEQAQVNGGITYGLGGAEYQLRYGQYVLEPVNGLPANTFVACQAKNLVFGTGLMADHNEIRIADGDDFGRLDDQVRMKMVYTAGVQYYNSAEIIWYLTTT